MSIIMRFRFLMLFLVVFMFNMLFYSCGNEGKNVSPNTQKLSNELRNQVLSIVKVDSLVVNVQNSNVHDSLAEVTIGCYVHDVPDNPDIIIDSLIKILNRDYGDSAYSAAIFISQFDEENIKLVRAKTVEKGEVSNVELPQ